ncbi:Acetylcholine receptor subunit delta [Takifugu flavidus]|uniref:Acetylcholine receptor subunit delta n=1 Tax=Takifugu flavidus TaxID=433684 RepID=A0A5C6MG21_9TELE|nr:Acetylcholine receptor subunit delta [Takifugu flavidus]
MQSRGEDAALLEDTAWTLDLAFLTDITGKRNSLNWELQGKGTSSRTNTEDASLMHICQTHSELHCQVPHQRTTHCNDAQFNVAYYCNVLVDSTGLCYWLPPIKYFPFDWQNCTLKFTSLTYNAKEIRLLLKEDIVNETKCTVEWIIIDPASFTENGEWEIIHRPAKRNTYKHIPMESNKHQDITFYLVIRRKPLSTWSTSSSPACSSPSWPRWSTTCPQTAPETSTSVPLIVKYLMFIMVVVMVVVLNCVVVLNLHFRTPSTHVMSEWTKQSPDSWTADKYAWVRDRPNAWGHLFLQRLPHILHMSRPAEAEPYWDGALPRRSSSVGYMASAEEYDSVKSRSELMFEKQSGRQGLEKDNWSGIAGTVDRLCLFLVTPVMTFDTVIIFLRGICNQPPHLPFKGDPHDSREENPRLL